MKRRDFSSWLATTLLGSGIAHLVPARKLFIKPEAPPELRQWERLRDDRWVPCEFEELRRGDRMRPVGEPFIYTVWEDFMDRGLGDNNWIMVCAVERTDGCRS